MTPAEIAEWDRYLEATTDVEPRMTGTQMFFAPFAPHVDRLPRHGAALIVHEIEEARPEP